MKQPQHPNPLRELLLVEAGRPFEKLIGWASAAVACSLLALAIFFLAAIVRGSSQHLGLWSLLAFTGAVAYFFATIAYRLLSQQPNEVGSVASPAMWLWCLAFFASLTAFFIFCAVAFRSFSMAQGAALSGLLALLSFGAAQHFRRRK